MAPTFSRLLPLVVTTAMAAPTLLAQPPAAPRLDVLPLDEWRRIDEASWRGLRYLAEQQQSNGSFPTAYNGQPGVTALATLAFLQHGHLPGRGPYGETLDRAVRFIVSTQRVNGLLSVRAHDGPIVYTEVQHEIGTSAAYNHAIAGLALAELYGMTGGGDERLRDAISLALEVTLTMQGWEKDNAADQGGWRYLHRFDQHKSDLSIAGWSLKFLRSAKNAGFEPPTQAIDDAVGYVLRCFSPELKSFEYCISARDRRTRAMAGVGILALAHSSRHNRPEALHAADFILQHGFDRYNQQVRVGNHSHNSDRYHYGVFYCTQAMYQIGGRHWEQFFPPTARTLLANQNRDGSWQPEGAHDGQYGRSYTTAMVLLALGAPNQLLPIYQR